MGLCAGQGENTAKKESKIKHCLVGLYTKLSTTNAKKQRKFKQSRA